jgi:hypothetical protein
MFSGTLTVDEVNELAEAPFYIYAFEQDTNEGNILIFWNSNIVVGVCDQTALEQEDYTLFRNNGVFLKRCIRLPNMEHFQTLVVLYPIAYNYPLQNSYLQSSFAAAQYIPSSTKILDEKVAGAHAVKSKEGHELFYLQFKPGDLPRWIPDWTLVSGLLFAMLFSITWIHLIAITLAKRRSAWAGLAVIATACLLLPAGIYLGGIPFHLGELSIFSSQLYAASTFFPSLGVLLLDMFAILWMVIFLLIFFNDRNVTQTNHRSRVVLIPLCCAALLVLAISPVYLLRSLVIDSRISFDVSNFYAINYYTVVGLLAVALIAGNAAALIYWVNKKLNEFTKPAIKYVVLLLGAGVAWFLAGNLRLAAVLPAVPGSARVHQRQGFVWFGDDFLGGLYCAYRYGFYSVFQRRKGRIQEKAFCRKRSAPA